MKDNLRSYHKCNKLRQHQQETSASICVEYITSTPKRV